MKSAFTAIAALLLAGSTVFAAPDNAYSEKFMARLNQVFGKNSGLTKTQEPAGRIDLTRLLAEGRRNKALLTSEAIDALEQASDRPTNAEYTLDSSMFRYQWAESGADAVDPTDNDNNTIPDFIDSIIAYMDTVYQKYVDAGYIMPPSDGTEGGDEKYDIYFSTSDAGDGVYGFVAFETEIGDNPKSSGVTETMAGTSFMVLRSEYSTMGDTPDEIRNAIRTTCAHEFFHAIQYGYHSEWNGFFSEIAAVWGEEFVFPGADNNFQYISNRYQNTDIPLNILNEETDSIATDLYDYAYDAWYGGWLFLQYITEAFGDSIVRTMYDNALTSPELAAMDAAIREAGSQSDSLLSMVRNFHCAIALMTSNSLCNPLTFSRGDAYYDYLVNTDGITEPYFEGAIDYSGSQVTYDSESDGNGVLMRLSADYIYVEASENFEVKTTVDAQCNNTFSVTLLKIAVDANDDIVAFDSQRATGNNGIFLITVSDAATYDYYFLVVANEDTVRNFASVQYSIAVDQANTTAAIAGIGKADMRNMFSIQSMHASQGLRVNLPPAATLAAYSVNGRQVVSLTAGPQSTIIRNIPAGALIYRCLHEQQFAQKKTVIMK
ncbi:MAG: hypothetical protein GF350_03055 [Chitinivibrionales bacterium]|nr:hypothetical protein [Chitinivibrionales bacterium]